MITEVDLVTDTFILMKSLRSKLTLFWTMTTSTRTVTLTIPSSSWHKGRRMLTSNNKQITFIILRMKLAWNLNSCRSSFFSGILTKQDNNVGCGHPYCGHWVNLTNWDNKKTIASFVSIYSFQKYVCSVCFPHYWMLKSTNFPFQVGVWCLFVKYKFRVFVFDKSFTTRHDTYRPSLASPALTRII